MIMSGLENANFCSGHSDSTKSEMPWWDKYISMPVGAVTGDIWPRSSRSVFSLGIAIFTGDFPSAVMIVPGSSILSQFQVEIGTNTTLPRL